MDGSVYGAQTYMKLTFQYKFKEEDLGNDVIFAYAAPYGYTDLINDLGEVKDSLLIGCKDQSEIKYLNSQQSPDTEKLNQAKKKGGLLPQIQKLPRMSRHDFDHQQIKRLANRQMTMKVTNFENKLLKKRGKDPMVINPAKKDEAQQEFEITNDYLYYRQEVIAHSIGGLKVFQLTFTKRPKAGSIKHKQKQVIYIQARLHPGETHGSYVMRHIMREFALNYKKYDAILRSSIVKLVPMVNPDGVVIGNSRSSLAGVDLNRRWASPSAIIHPEISFLKKSMLRTLRQSQGISVFCDLHGHNKLNNCFFYGCNKAPNEGLLSWTKTRLFPKIFQMQEPIFDFTKCKFSQEVNKYNTARVVVWSELKVTNSFTLEISMFGKQKASTNTKSLSREQVVQLCEQDFKSIGINFLSALRHFVIVEKELEQEFKPGGWLKKKKLDEITREMTLKKNRGESDYIQKQTRKTYQTARKQQLSEGRRKNFLVTSQDARRKIRRELREKQNSISIGDDKYVRNSEKEENLNKQEEDNGQELIEERSRSLSQQQINGFESDTVTSQKSANFISPVKQVGNQTKSRQKGQKEREKTENKRCKLVNKKFASDLAIEEEKFIIPECLVKFFSQEEFLSALKASQIPPEANNTKQKQEETESDSVPSCDNFEQQKMQSIFIEAVSEDERESFFPKQKIPIISKGGMKKQERIDQLSESVLKTNPINSRFKAENSSDIRASANKEIKIPQQTFTFEQLGQDMDQAKNDQYRILASKIQEVKRENKKLNERFKRLERQFNLGNHPSVRNQTNGSRYILRGQGQIYTPVVDIQFNMLEPLQIRIPPPVCLPSQLSIVSNNLQQINRSGLVSPPPLNGNYENIQGALNIQSMNIAQPSQIMGQISKYQNRYQERKREDDINLQNTFTRQQGYFPLTNPISPKNHTAGPRQGEGLIQINNYSMTPILPQVQLQKHEEGSNVRQFELMRTPQSKSINQRTRNQFVHSTNEGVYFTNAQVTDGLFRGIPSRPNQTTVFNINTSPNQRLREYVSMTEKKNINLKTQNLQLQYFQSDKINSGSKDNSRFQDQIDQSNSNIIVNKLLQKSENQRRRIVPEQKTFSADLDSDFINVTNSSQESPLKVLNTDGSMKSRQADNDYKKIQNLDQMALIEENSIEFGEGLISPQQSCIIDQPSPLNKKAIRKLKERILENNTKLQQQEIFQRVICHSGIGQSQKKRQSGDQQQDRFESNMIGGYLGGMNPLKSSYSSRKGERR